MMRAAALIISIGIALGIAAVGGIVLADRFGALGTICIKSGTGYC